MFDNTMIRVDYPNDKPSDLEVTNELGQTQVYHLSRIEWHVPSEHTIDDHQFDAEMQLYHTQYATNKEVAMSFLFDKELELIR